MVVIAVHGIMALVLFGLAALTVAAGCGGDLCLNGYVLSLLAGPLIGLFTGFVLRWLIGRSSPLVAVDAVLAALILQAAAPTPRADFTSIVLAVMLLAIPLFAAVVAIPEVTPHRRETIGLGIVLVAEAVWLWSRGGWLAIAVPIGLLLVLVRNRRTEVARWSPSSAVLDSRPHGDDREE
jgi:hypothetical protein